MAIIKAYTDISQSKKLAEILPLESADMYYILMPDGAYNHFPLTGRKTELSENTDIPCWSLAALLGVLPQGYSLGNKKSNGKYYVCMTCAKHDVIEYDNPVDACVSMIEQINKLNLL